MPRSRPTILINALSIAALVVTSFMPWPNALIAAPRQTIAVYTGLFRTRVSLPNAASLARLNTLGVRVIQSDVTSALVLVTETQLETLARLPFKPQATNELGQLTAAHAADTPWLAQSLQPTLAQAASTQAQWANAANGKALTPALDMQTLLAAFTPEQQTAIAALSSVDDDDDGLTNTQEQWWCTDSLNADTDSDGRTDGAEIQALKDWMGNRRASAPNETPWPNWPPQRASCEDKDHDSIPNLAERWELGLSMDLESTDGDKFDDGQELFGVTYCPGGDLSCNYGDLPRSSDSGYVGAVMPAWVKAPGNHPMVAAYPVPEIDVVPSSLHVQAVTVVTTDHTINSGTERTYSTAKTEGASTSVADTVTWNEWQEVSTALQQRVAGPNRLSSSAATSVGNWLKKIGSTVVNGTKFVLADAVASSGCKDAKVSLSIGVVSVEQGTGTGYHENWCKRTMGWAEKIYPGYIVPDQDTGQNQYQPSDIRLDARTDVNVQNQIVLNNNFDTSNIVAGLEGVQYAQLQTGQIIGERLFDIANILAAPIRTDTSTNGKSWGGSQTTTHSQYEEHTVTNAEAFSSGESWGTATAVDSSHAADLWFTYKIRNAGMEYAREIANLAFNVYIGSDPNPAYTYFTAPEVGGDGKFHNFMPGEEHQYTAHHIPLTLQQMAAIDTGAPIRIVLEDYTYGVDELFYQNAVGLGVTVAMEDGADDGDETIDNYVIPTFTGDTVMDVLARYFPNTTDADGNLIAIWTPEYRADTPAWCDAPSRVGTTLWCRHALSTADWWNVYTNGLGNGSEGFQATPAAPNTLALFRFNSDSDLDGYSNRSELRLGTDPNSAASFPKPEVLAGLNSLRNGNGVTATLSLLNTGLYDAYGVEAVMIAPDTTISITNNTVGGSGRVRAQNQVVVGSHIHLPSPLPAAWTQSGHAKPVSADYYTGAVDRLYTFTALNTGNVTTNTLQLSWNDGLGASGTLNYGAGYLSPTPLAVGAYGVKVGLLSGSVNAGEIFTVTATTPRDTFQYIINTEPYTPPIVVLSYNDPQGNHRLVLPPATMMLTDPVANLAPYAGQMWQDPGVEIVTTAPFTTGVNSTNLLVNNPTTSTLASAHLFLEFVNISGTVASEVPLTVTLPPGPSVVPMTWNTSVFSPTYQASEDYIVLAFLTDYQGNIMDTGGRPLSSFQADPQPAFAMSATDSTWNFGTAPQGTVLKRDFTVANTGLLGLLTFVGAPAGVSLSQIGSRTVSPADATTYEISLKTADLPLGPYSQTITLRTSDPANPVRTVQVSGTITAAPADTPPGALQRPLDWPVAIAGAHTQGEWITYTHTLGPDPATLHPVKVFSENYTTLWGMGKYATQFGTGATASADMFGDGSEGDLIVASGQISYTDNTRSALAASATSGQTSLTLANATGFAVGHEVLVIQIQGTGAGNYEFGTIANIVGNMLTLGKNLANTYTVGGNFKAQVIRVPHYQNVTVQNGGVLTAYAWDGASGGIVAFRAAQIVTVEAGGGINLSGKGFRGGPGGGTGAYSGESYTGPAIADYLGGNGSAGHPGWQNSTSPCPNLCPGGGGGASYGTMGIAGTQYGGAPGVVFDNPTATVLLLGSGGGGGAVLYNNNYGGTGGTGGGALFIVARDISVNGSYVAANGGDGNSGAGTWGAGAGAGAGGTIRFIANTASLGSVNAVGGTGAGGGSNAGVGGNGGSGVIRVEYCDTLSITANPIASTQKLNCYITEQVESAPYNTGRLNLPETFASGRTYNIQYGRLLTFTTASEVTTTLRVPAGAYITGTLNALVSNVAAGNTTVQLDIGNDGTWDWQATQSLNGSGVYTSTNLASAFNTYWATHSPALTSTVDIPVRISLDKAGQVLLTNVQLNPAGSMLRYARLSAQTYTTATLGLLVGASGSGPLTVAADVGDNGSIDWTYTGATAFPVSLNTSNLASAFNAYLSGKAGDVDVPVRFYISPDLPFKLTSLSATPGAQTDVTPNALVFSAASPIESDSVTITATINNPGSRATGGFTAAFFAAPPGLGSWYLGSALVANVPAGGSAQASIAWNTLGFTGTMPITVTLDPYNRLVETNEANNAYSTSLTIRTRPDLRPTALTLSNFEPVVSEAVTVTVPVQNSGQTNAGAQTVSFYSGNPKAGGTLIGNSTMGALTGGASSNATLTWTPSAPGPYRLFARADRTGQVSEFDEGNNDVWRDVYVGVRGPVVIDSGAMAGDAVYSTTVGYGYIDGGIPDVIATCNGDPQSANTLRRDPSGEVVYQFDHLQPGHFYHLDLMLYECDGAGRQESVWVDGDSQIAGPEDLGDGKVHRLSLLLDPALYADRTIQISIKEPGIDGAVVSAISLYDIDYRYADAGGSSEPQYPGSRGYGWLDGTPATWTVTQTLPYQTVRVNTGYNELRYRFDSLDPAKRYNLRFTFWQPSGAARIQKVQVDGADTNLLVDSGDFQIHRVSTALLPATYATDGSIMVSIIRTNASAGAMVNEIALEEETLAGVGGVCVTQSTPYFSDAYGAVTIAGVSATPGTVVQALNARGDTVGCFTVSTSGQYGFMHLYGEDNSVVPPIPGLRDGELVSFRVNGSTAVAAPLLYWHDDRLPHNVNLQAGIVQAQSLLFAPGWNLFSLNVEPPAPLVALTLQSMDGRYDLVLGEHGIYSVKLPPQFNSLSELHSRLGYYGHITSTASVNALVEGVPVTDTAPIPLHVGWNWIGAPNTTQPITLALQSITGNYQRVISLDKAYDVNLPQFSTLTQLTPGEGYLLYATSAVTLTYPLGGIAAPGSQTTKEEANCSTVSPTPYLTLLYGTVQLNGLPAPIGTRVEALTPDGQVAGCAVLRAAGLLPFMHVYGADNYGTPGFAEGESLTFRLNGFSVTSSPTITWSNDLTPHPVELQATLYLFYFPFVSEGR